MTDQLVYHLNNASLPQLTAHLRACDDAFVPPLSRRIDIENYANKLASKAARFEMWEGNVLIGLVAAYCDAAAGRIAFISNVSVLPESQHKGIASQLMTYCIDHSIALDLEGVELEVDSLNAAAISLYKKYGFSIKKTAGQTATMYLAIGR